MIIKTKIKNQKVLESSLQGRSTRLMKKHETRQFIPRKIDKELIFNAIVAFSPASRQKYFDTDLLVIAIGFVV